MKYSIILFFGKLLDYSLFLELIYLLNFNVKRTTYLCKFFLKKYYKSYSICKLFFEKKRFFIYKEADFMEKTLKHNLYSVIKKKKYFSLVNFKK